MVVEMRTVKQAAQVAAADRSILTIGQAGQQRRSAAVALRGCRTWSWSLAGRC